MVRPSQFVDLVCRKTTTYKSCCLFLTTPGGDPHSAYRIIRCLRSKYPDKVTLAVAGPCKSAGTLIALGAHEIAMSPTSELGPLDVQLTKPDEIIPNGSGLEIFQALAVTTTHAFEAFERCMLDIIEHSLGSISTKTAAEISRDFAVGLFAPITGQIDPNRLGEVQRAIKIAHAYGEKLGGPNLRPRAIDRLVEEYPSHGFVIDMEEAKKLFVHVRTFSDTEEKICILFKDVLRHISPRNTVTDVGDWCRAALERINGPSRKANRPDLPSRASSRAKDGADNEERRSGRRRRRGSRIPATPAGKDQNRVPDQTEAHK
jgi:hypothetical protein